MPNAQVVTKNVKSTFEAIPFTCKCRGATAYSGMKPASNQRGKRPDGRHMWVR